MMSVNPSDDHTMKRILTSLGILACLAFSACDRENPVDPDDQEIESILLTRAEEGYVRHNNEFAWNLFADLARVTPGNFVISPLSATFTLAMIDNGAIGQTRDEINRVLGYGEDGIDAINEFCHKMMEGVPNIDRRIEMALANAAVINRGYPVKQTFLNCLARYYLAEVFHPDFSDPSALALINNWCSDKTRGKIPNIIDSFQPNSEVCFLNALYFKAPWTIQFDPDESRPEPFYDYTGNIKTGEATMMHLQADLEYFEDEYYTALDLDLGKKAFKMTFYLPRLGKTVEEAITSLTDLGSFQPPVVRRSRPVDLKLPRFQTDSEFDLNESLKRLGMPTAFNSEGGFLNMTDSPGLYLGLVKQKATITVNEEGAEAAAVTIGEMVEKGSLFLDFHADRPFFYTIYDSGTGSILFMGRYACVD